MDRKYRPAQLMLPFDFATPAGRTLCRAWREHNCQGRHQRCRRHPPAGLRRLSGEFLGVRAARPAGNAPRTLCELLARTRIPLVGSRHRGNPGAAHARAGHGKGGLSAARNRHRRDRIDRHRRHLFPNRRASARSVGDLGRTLRLRRRDAGRQSRLCGGSQLHHRCPDCHPADRQPVAGVSDRRRPGRRHRHRRPRGRSGQRGARRAGLSSGSGEPPRSTASPGHGVRATRRPR